MLSILHRIAAGDSRAVSECIEAYTPIVWSVARRLSRNTADVEDAVQEVFLDVWRHAARFDSRKGSEKTFIMTLARRRLIDRYRQRQLEPWLDNSQEVLDSLQSGSSDQAERSSDLDCAVIAMATLRADYRRVIELSFFGGLTQIEISSTLRIPLGTVKSHMRRGLLAVRAMLSPPVADDDGATGLAPQLSTVPMVTVAA
jgi:RNA polymerase sigma-70 factor (ECF subfamily)